jgi:hypothetical protein
MVELHDYAGARAFERAVNATTFTISHHGELVVGVRRG